MKPDARFVPVAMLEPGWIGREPNKTHEGWRATVQPGSIASASFVVHDQRTSDPILFCVEDGIEYAVFHGGRAGFVR